MTDLKFIYDEELFSACARSALVAFVARDDKDSQPPNHPNGSETDDVSCTILHKKHAQHYGNPPPRPFRKAEEGVYIVDAQLRRFLEGVLHIQKHNSNPHTLHRLALNQFTDTENAVSKLNDVGLESSPFESFLDWDTIDNEWVFTTLENIVDISANLTFGHGGMGHLHHWSKHHSSHSESTSDEKIRFPDRSSDPHFAVPTVDDPDKDGDLLKVKPRHSLQKVLKKGLYNDDDFAAHLNWATENNPDGVSIVKDAFDQGGCGSCWAFAATGSLEASASRRQAHEAYREYLQQATARRDRKSAAGIHKEALEFARDVELAAFEMANLSIQELIDCDTAADQGCTGGNPLLAFYFIHRYGLTTWSRYPYVGFEDECHKKWVSKPIVKVKSWGIVSPDHENDMQLVLRHIGPVAVGVNGAEQSFLSYQEGIFDKPNCRQLANHALLITGYGQEKMNDGRIVKYWIARNSWGKGWGENGYVRVKRGDGRKGTKGVCGIARSPSVALGGILLANRHSLAPYHTPKLENRGYTTPLSTTSAPSFCTRLGFDTCGSIVDIFENNRALFLGLTGIFFTMFVAVWPLTLQCRRRRRRLRMLRETRAAQRQQVTQRNGARSSSTDASEAGEIVPLLKDRSKAGYGL